MSEQEHERWIRSKLEAEWSYGEMEDRDRRIQPALVPWGTISDDERRLRYGQYWECVGTGELTEDMKEHDRGLIRKYPVYLALAGYTAMKCEDRTDLDEGDSGRAGGPKPSR